MWILLSIGAGSLCVVHKSLWFAALSAALFTAAIFIDNRVDGSKPGDETNK